MGLSPNLEFALQRQREPPLIAWNEQAYNTSKKKYSITQPNLILEPSIDLLDCFLCIIIARRSPAIVAPQSPNKNFIGEEALLPAQSFFNAFLEFEYEDHLSWTLTCAPGLPHGRNLFTQ